MPQPPTREQIQIIGLDDETLRSPEPVTRVRAAITGFLVLLIAATVLMSVVTDRARNDDAPVLEAAEISTAPSGESALLHPLGGAVDTVEQFIVRVNYGQADFDVQIFGCRSDTEPGDTESVTVDCAVAGADAPKPGTRSTTHRLTVRFGRPR